MKIPTIQMPANSLETMPNTPSHTPYAPSSPALVNPAQQTALPIEDIHLPTDVSPWPPAIGWWLLVLIAALLVWGTRVAFKKYRKKWGYRREALRLLAQVYADHLVHSAAATSETIATLRQRTTNTLLSLVKRTAMSAYSEQDLQSLYGEAWVCCLNRQTKQPYFDDKTVVEYLTRQQYQTATTSETDHHSLNIDSLYHACQQWIKKHHTQFQQEAE